MRNNTISKSVFIMAACLAVTPFHVFAQDSLALEAGVGSVGNSATVTPLTTLDNVDPEFFCRKAASLSETIRTDAALRAAEHRADMDRLSLARDEEKRKISMERTELRAKEDAARDALLSILREQASTTAQVDVINEFSTTSAKILASLRTQSDKARESYAKVTRNDALVERAVRNRALDVYIDHLDNAALKAEEKCAKGARGVDALAAYNVMLKGAKLDLAKNLHTKKTSLESRARDAHLAELSRLDREYRAAMQQALARLIGVFPEFFDTLIATEPPSATTTSATSSAPTGVVP